MKSLLPAPLVLCSLGCAVLNPAAVTSSTPATVASQQMEPYQGPKARVAVMGFENSTGVYYEATRTGTTVQVVDASAPPVSTTTIRDPIGTGMREQLVTSLAQTGAFILLERDRLHDVLQEQDLGRSARVRQETAARVGDVEGADFFIYGAVTEYQPSQASVAAGGGAGALPRPSDPTVGPGNVFVQILTRTAAGVFGEQDHVAIDLRLVDARTGRIVNATSVEGRPRDLGGALGGQFGPLLLGIGGQYQTPIQKAIRACMIKAANWIAQNTLNQGIVRLPGPTPPADDLPRAAQPEPTVFTVAVQRANVRVRPTLASPVVTTVPRGTRAERMGEDGAWINVRLSDGTTGWIRGDLLQRHTQP